MNNRRNVWTAGLVVALGLLAGAATAKERGPFKMTIRFMPQESVGDSAPSLAMGISDHPIKLSITDGRTVTDPIVIGESSDDDDRVWPVQANNDVLAWSDEALKKSAADWGIRVAPDAPLSLEGRLMRFKLVENNQALGSTYNAEVGVSFKLVNGQGQTLWEGEGAGDATRYGKSRSQENASEVLSDATREAYAAVFAEPALQDAWLGKSGASASVGSADTDASSGLSPHDLLAELVKLKKQGFTADLLVDYVNQKSLSNTLSADDMVEWKNAGMAEEVIKAALARAGS